jgi:hypothetical protein
MNADQAAKKPQASTDKVDKKDKEAAFPASDFSDLRSFLRGYLHQDMREEYGSPEAAAHEFCSDASGEERAAVAGQWAQFLAHTSGQSLEAINRILTGPLGSAYALSEDDVARLSAVFSPPKKRK